MGDFGGDNFGGDFVGDFVGEDDLINDEIGGRVRRVGELGRIGTVGRVGRIGRVGRVGRLEGVGRVGVPPTGEINGGNPEEVIFGRDGNNLDFSFSGRYIFIGNLLDDTDEPPDMRRGGVGVSL